MYRSNVETISANYGARTYFLPHRSLSQKFLQIPQQYFTPYPKKDTQSSTIADLTLWIHRTEDEPKMQFNAIASKKVRAP